MRILVCSNLYPPHVLGGYEILCRQVVDHLANMGHSCSVLTSNYKSDREQDYVGEVMTRRWLHLNVPFGEPPTVSRTRRMKVGGHNGAMMRKALKIEKPDIVYVWSQLRLTLGAALAAQRTGLPLAFNLNDEHLGSYVPVGFGVHPKKLIRFATDRSLFRQTTLAALNLESTTSISQCLKDRLQSAGVPVGSSEVIYQGIPIERFPCKPLEEATEDGPIRILYAGQLHEYKGPHTLLEAAERANDRLNGRSISVSIAGAGDSEYVERLTKQSECMKVPVEFLGQVPHSRLPEIYREHQIFAFTSLWHEPFGLTHLEAMASGTPVMSTAIGGTAEFLRHEHNSLVFEPGNVEQMAQQIVELATNKERCLSLVKTARQMVEEQFTVQRYAEDLEKFLQRTLAKKTGVEAAEIAALPSQH
jgi:glycogen(starch) synthase